MDPEQPIDETESLMPNTDPAQTAKRYAQQRQERLDSHPEQIGPYKILKVLGEGGMGVVYLAEQTKPIHRRVALKIIKLGMDTKQVIARFETEREALALMNHANVAKVFDAGVTEQGRPYFAMEYVAGIPITEYCDKHRLNTEERLRLFSDVCHAVQHAHQKGIIHRDIKPSNVLVSEIDGTATVKVIDFGIAKATQQKLTDLTLWTETGQIVGTPAYMSPEQAEAGAHDIDTRTDIYSLGAVLYELLVGARPFDDQMLRQAALAEIQRIIREVDPPKPSTRLSSLQSARGETARAAAFTPRVQPPDESGGSGSRGSVLDIAHHRRTEPKTLIRQIRGDLDWIVMKCLEKDRSRRYDTANGVALEIQRYLNNEPVLAGPPSAAYRVRKFVRRNRVGVAAGTAVTLSLILGLIGTATMYVRAERARAEATAERDRAHNEAERARKEQVKAERISGFMSDILKGAGPAVAMGRDTTMLREMLDGAAKRIKDGELTDAPEAELKLRQTVGMTYVELGVYERARELIEPSVQLAHTLYGEEHPDVAESLNNLAIVLEGQGNYPEAERLHREALAMRRKLLGEEHPEVATSLNNLARVLEREGNYPEAERLHREELAMSRKLLGEEHPEVATSLNNLALVLERQGNYPEAERMYREALAMYRRLLGEEHPNAATGLSNLAGVLGSQGNYPEAERLHREALAMHRKLLGEVHPEVARSLNNLAVVLYSQGNYPEAERLWRETLAMYRRLLGEEHPDVASSLNNLATVLYNQGNYPEAERLQREALAMDRKLLGEEHPNVATSLNNLARVLEEQGNYPEAARLQREALTMRRKLLGEEHPDVVASLINLAFVLENQGNYPEAERLHREALAMRRRLLGEEHLDVAASLSNLAGVLERQGNYPEAERLYGEALAMRRKLLGEEHPLVANSLNNLGRVLERQGSYEEAEALARECLRICEAKLPANHRLPLQATGLLGAALSGRHQFAEAEPLLLAAQEALKDRAGVTSSRKRELVEYIVKLYDAWDAAEPGKGYDQKAAEWRGLLEGTEGKP